MLLTHFMYHISVLESSIVPALCCIPLQISILSVQPQKTARGTQMMWSAKDSSQHSNDVSLEKSHFKIILLHNGYNYYIPAISQYCAERNMHLRTLQNNLDYCRATRYFVQNVANFKFSHCCIQDERATDIKSSATGCSRNSTSCKHFIFQ